MTDQPEALIDAGDVLLELDGDGVARLRLNRPGASNAMNIGLLRALYEAVLRVHREPRARCVLLSGEGRNFCAGGDVEEFAAQGEDLPGYVREATAWLGAAASALMRLDAPVVTVVHGFAAGGGGLGLVCASDIVVAGASARFMSAATRVAMAPDAGSSVTLAQIVGVRKAMEIFLTDPLLSAQDALDIGLVTRVVADDELRDEALALARRLAAGPTRSLGATKRLVWDGLGSTVEARLHEEARAVAELSGTADAREGLAAVVDKRGPQFTGR
jgi:2-(1,2-epoxy-1,2-dihydrophenyl)acetyl-CoA isomerase